VLVQRGEEEARETAKKSYCFVWANLDYRDLGKLTVACAAVVFVGLLRVKIVHTFIAMRVCGGGAGGGGGVGGGGGGGYSQITVRFSTNTWGYGVDVEQRRCAAVWEKAVSCTGATTVI